MDTGQLGRCLGPLVWRKTARLAMYTFWVEESCWLLGHGWAEQDLRHCTAWARPGVRVQGTKCMYETSITLSTHV